MKKTLLFIFLIIGIFGFSQEVELFDVQYDSDNIFKNSFRIRVTNNYTPARTISASLKYIEDSNKINIPLELVSGEGSNSHIYESEIITLGVNNFYNHWDISVSASILIDTPPFPTVVPIWNKNVRFNRVDNLQYFSYYILKSCDNSNGGTFRVNIQGAQLFEGEVYALDLGFGERHYNVININSNTGSTNADYILRNNEVSGPLFVECDATDAYDLELLESQVLINSLCSNCQTLLSDLNPGFSGGAFPVNKHIMTTSGSFVNTNITIKNKGENPSKATRIKFYLSIQYNTTNGIIANNKTLNIPTLQRNEEYVVNPSLSSFDFGTIQPGNYYLVMDVEEGDNDINITNNYVSVPIIVQAGKIEVIRPRQVEVYSFDGILKSTFNVENEKEEKESIRNLEKGYYIIKRKDKTYKVKVE